MRQKCDVRLTIGNRCLRTFMHSFTQMAMQMGMNFDANGTPVANDDDDTKDSGMRIRNIAVTTHQSNRIQSILILDHQSHYYRRHKPQALNFQTAGYVLNASVASFMLKAWMM
eukprot:78697_1